MARAHVRGPVSDSNGTRGWGWGRVLVFRVLSSKKITDLRKFLHLPATESHPRRRLRVPSPDSQASNRDSYDPEAWAITSAQNDSTTLPMQTIAKNQNSGSKNMQRNRLVPMFQCQRCTQSPFLGEAESWVDQIQVLRTTEGLITALARVRVRPQGPLRSYTRTHEESIVLQ
ncbi:hypothetical protein BofuT4_P153180.1 [Botrytis cinerea T4]|uniref:Uncharacterized protein n=1 Tax=Botryotinia fuckeliana (strain T4) TaxID=999810 RepID=G2YVV8_BOTF4|nr:hypothetical protein BofuT4_P153180.1 [Botrytis cinerea T4]